MEGIRLDFVLEFSSKHAGLNTSDVRNRVLVDTNNCSLLEKFKSQDAASVGSAQFYICHAWSNLFQDTLDCIKVIAEEQFGGVDRVFVWIDIVCFNQHHLENATEDARNDMVTQVEDIIRSIGNTIVALPAWGVQKETTFRRTWCLWEIAVSTKVTLVLGRSQARLLFRDLQHRPDGVIGEICEISIVASKTSLSVDWQILQKRLNESSEETGALEKTVQDHIFRWIVSEGLDQIKVIQTQVENGNQSSNLLLTLADFVSGLGGAFSNRKLYTFAIELYESTIAMHSKNRGDQKFDEMLSLDYERLGDVMVATHDLKMASEYFREAHELNSKLGDNTKSADTVLKLANATCELGDMEYAGKLFDRAIALTKGAEEVTTENEPEVLKLIECMTSKSGYFVRTNSIEKAISLHREVVKLELQLFNVTNEEDILKNLTVLGDLLKSSGEYIEAAEYFELDLQLKNLCRRAEDGSLVMSSASLCDVTTAVSMKNLAECLFWSKDPKYYSDAVTCCRCAVDLDIQFRGPVTLFVVDDLKLLADIERSRGNIDKADALVAKATSLKARVEEEHEKSKRLALSELELPNIRLDSKANKDYKRLYTLLEELSSHYAQQEHSFAKAVGYLCEATHLEIGILTNAESDDSENLISRIRGNLRQLYRYFSQAKPDQALVKHALQYTKLVKLFYYDNPQSDHVVLALNQCGTLLLGLEKYDQAVAVLEQAGTLADDVYDEPNEQWVQLLHNTVSAYAGVRDHLQCFNLLNTILEMRQYLEGSLDSKDAARDLFQIASVQVERVHELGSGNIDAKTDLWESVEEYIGQAIDIYEDLDDDENLAIMHRYLANIFLEQDRYEDAQKEMSHVIELAINFEGDDGGQAEQDKQLLAKINKASKNSKTKVRQEVCRPPEPPQDLVPEVVQKQSEGGG
mmetsp:Transcript_5302/g.9417  ORF Transcript_5302/g.9417 Transcript_5302/m.9417 type:complete len:919 (-) Transcript_5302:980-3736(-)